MRRFTLFRWAAALTLAIALTPAAASAQEGDTLTISGTFSMDYMSGEYDLNWFVPDLLAVYANGHEHTWTLTLHGTTQSHYTNGSYYATDIHATSFDLEFFGPDAATLNGLVSEHLAGGDVDVYLQNTYYTYGGGFAIMHVWVSDGDPGMYFYTGHDIGVSTLFPTDADGYPVVGPEPFSIDPDYTEMGYSDLLSGTGGYVGSLAGLVTFELGSGCETFVAPDLDHDCDVDTADVAAFIVCASRAGVPVTPACQSRDLDDDDDVDSNDFGILQRCFNGANVPVDPACAD